MPDLEARDSSSLTPRTTPLSLVIEDDNQEPSGTYARRISTNSSPSSESPLYQSAVDSTTPLILIHDDDDDNDDGDGDGERPLILDFSSDEDSDDLDDSLSPLYQINGKLSIPPLPPFTIFVYLLSPYLKLGALLLPYYQLPLKYGLSGFLISAVLAVVARHLLYLLARYLRKADLEEVVSSTFVSAKKRGRRGERRRDLFRFLVRFGSAALRVFLSVTYLHECVHFIIPLFSSMTTVHQSSIELGLTFGAIILALLLSYPGSLASRLVIYTTNLSIFIYLLWLAAFTYLYTQGTLPLNTRRFSSGSIWDGLVTTAFIFTSSNTLPLYASTKGTIQPLLFDSDTAFTLPTGRISPSAGNARTSRRDGKIKQPLYRSFKFLSVLSVAVAAALILPLIGFAAFPNEDPRAPASATELRGDHTASNSHPEQFPDWKFPFPPGDSTPATRIQTFIIPALASLTLLFGVPQLLITMPTFPAGSFKWLCGGLRYSSTSNFQTKLSTVFRKSAIGLSMIILTIITIYFDLSTPMRSLTATFAVLATYYVPAILHILAHTFKSPLAIILPSTYFSSPFSTTSTPRPSSNLSTSGMSGRMSNESPRQSVNGNADYPTSNSARPQPAVLSSSARYRHTQSNREHDELLQRKERALQKRQMRRRIIWDISAWGIFFATFVVLATRARMV